MSETTDPQKMQKAMSLIDEWQELLGVKTWEEVALKMARLFEIAEEMNALKEKPPLLERET